MLDELIKKKISVDVFDPYFKKLDLSLVKKYNILKKIPIKKKYDAIVISVDHDYFKKIKVGKIKKICSNDKSIFDIKNTFPKENFFQI